MRTRKYFLPVSDGHPENLHIKLTHYRQRSNWDCGVSCVIMVLPRAKRSVILNKFDQICREEGFNKSTWTIDLCYLLSRFKIEHEFYTTTLGVHPGYKANSFYQSVLNKDEKRVNRKFESATKRGLKIRKGSVNAASILAHLKEGPVIALTNAKLLQCSVCKLNKISSEFRKCWPWPVPYQGHYIVVCGYNLPAQKIFYRNPSFHDRVCVMGIDDFEEARRSYGTDEDIIFIYN